MLVLCLHQVIETRVLTNQRAFFLRTVFLIRFQNSSHVCPLTRDITLHYVSCKGTYIDFRPATYTSSRLSCVAIRAKPKPRETNHRKVSLSSLVSDIRMYITPIRLKLLSKINNIAFTDITSCDQGTGYGANG